MDSLADPDRIIGGRTWSHAAYGEMTDWNSASSLARRALGMTLERVWAN